MSRNGTGTYTLPTGNPVVTNTSVSSTTHNATMADLAAEVTDSLSRTGRGGMLAPFLAVSGSLAAPSYSFTADPNTGIYLGGVDTINVTAGGQNVHSWSPTVSETRIFTRVTTAEASGGQSLEVDNTADGDAIFAASYTGTAVNAQCGGTSPCIIATSGNAVAVSAVSGGSGTAVAAASTTGYAVLLTGNATRAPLRLVPQATPSSAQEGDMYIDSTTHKLCVYLSGAWVAQT